MTPQRLVHLAASALAVLVLTTAAAAPAQDEPLVVASKKFPENALLGEILAQLLEASGVTVERKLNMGNTALVFENLKHGNVDVYAEYSGTALQFLELESSARDATSLRRSIEQRLKLDFGLFWGPPLGFDNSYALAARRAFAEKHQLRTLTDLARLARDGTDVRFGSTHEFLARSDGWPALKQAYGIVAEPRGIEHGLAFELLAQNQIDVTEVYTTEGLLHAHDLRLLVDDQNFFPPYAAAFLFSPALAEDARAMAAITRLAGRFPESRMRELNYEVEVERKRLADVAAQYLVEEGLTTAGTSAREPQRPHGEGVWAYLVAEQAQVLRRLREHVWLTFLAVLFSILIGVPLGYLATRNRWVSAVALGSSSIVQTIPALAFLVLMIPVATALSRVWGGDAMVLAALLALLAYGLLPIIRNTKEGLLQVDPAVIQAATGMGMTPGQRLYWVLLPLAAPFIIAGIRTSAVIGTGAATLAAFIGAGGLGEAIISGLSVQNYDEVLSGALPAAALALSFDGAFGLLQRLATPIPTDEGS